MTWQSTVTLTSFVLLRNVSGTSSSPLFLTIDSDIMAIPSYHGKTAGDPGYVNVIHLNHKAADVTITKGLQHPVGAAAF